ncbi:hypothetical protein COBT_002584 [Conglomerata obtusa]
MVSHRKNIKNILTGGIGTGKSLCKHEDVLEDKTEYSDGKFLDVERIQRIKLNCICMSDIFTGVENDMFDILKIDLFEFNVKKSFALLV